MARGRKTGRDISGWLIVDKPAGLTSTAVVNKARWLLKARKAGHAGTLDPAATGLLAIAFGEATKCVPYVMDALKAYEFTVRWGAATNTDDAEGEVIATRDTRPDRAAIQAALPAFTGDIRQVPPQYSAVKVDGVRAYALARGGEAPELSARDLHVDSLSLLDCVDADAARFKMVCGKGGYVRALARDLGQSLGCLGHVTALRRTWSGPFTLNQAMPWPDAPDTDPDPEAVEAALLPIEASLRDLPECRCAPDTLGRLRNGNPVEVLMSEAENGDPCWVSVTGSAVALAIYKFGSVHPNRVLSVAE